MLTCVRSARCVAAVYTHRLRTAAAARVSPSRWPAGSGLGGSSGLWSACCCLACVQINMGTELDSLTDWASNSLDGPVCALCAVCPPAAVRPLTPPVCLCARHGPSAPKPSVRLSFDLAAAGSACQPAGGGVPSRMRFNALAVGSGSATHVAAAAAAALALIGCVKAAECVEPTNCCCACVRPPARHRTNCGLQRRSFGALEWTVGCAARCRSAS